MSKVPGVPHGGFIIIGDTKPGKAAEVREMAKKRGAGVTAEELHELLAPLTLHYARWALINNDKQLLYAALFDTDFDTYVEDARVIFKKTGLSNFFEAMVGWPEDWETNPEAFNKFFKDRSVQSVFEYASYPDATVAEVQKGLKLRAAFSEMLDQMQ
jgi:hypothetical protein